MTIDLADVPIWAAIPAAAFLLIGAGLSLLGTLGLVRLQTFYDRIHAPTLATSWGAAGMVMASMIIFTTASARPVFHEILIGIFVTMTTPVTLMMLGRATLYRDRMDNSPQLPKSALHVPEPEDGEEEEPKA